MEQAWRFKYFRKWNIKWTPLCERMITRRDVFLKYIHVNSNIMYWTQYIVIHRKLKLFWIVLRIINSFMSLSDSLNQRLCYVFWKYQELFFLKAGFLCFCFYLEIDFYIDYYTITIRSPYLRIEVNDLVMLAACDAMRQVTS